MFARHGPRSDHTESAPSSRNVCGSASVSVPGRGASIMVPQPGSPVASACAGSGSASAAATTTAATRDRVRCVTLSLCPRAVARRDLAHQAAHAPRRSLGHPQRITGAERERARPREIGTRRQQRAGRVEQPQAA